MTIELIVMIFKHDEATPNARRALNTLRKSRSFGLNSAALVQRDSTGKAFIQQYSRYPAWELAIDSTFLLLFTNAIFKDNVEDRERNLLLTEFDEYFVIELDRVWQPSNSALLIFFPRESLVDMQHLINYLAEFSGTLIQTTIPERTIKAILELSKSTELSSVNDADRN
jgi:uncharacterized membrane protein